MTPTAVATRTSPPQRLLIGDLSFEVRESSRQTIGITVDRDGALIAHAPFGADRDELVQFAHEKRMWVYKKLAEKDLLLSARPTKEIASGEGFAYLGRSYRLLVANRAGASVTLERGRLMMRRSIARSGHGAETLIDWYYRKGRAWLPKRVAPWAQRMRVSPAEIDVRDLGYRWGSLGQGGRMNLHWAIMQLRPTLIDYVIVHELAHIREPHHTPEFWLQVERAMPDYSRVKDELARAGASLWLGPPAHR